MELEEKLARSRVTFLRKSWDSIKLVTFVLSIIINALVFGGYAKIFDVNSGIIPVPGILPAQLVLTAGFRYPALDYGRRTDGRRERGEKFFKPLILKKQTTAAMFSFGLLQLLLGVVIAIIHITDFGPLTIATHWSPPIPLNKRFDQIPRDSEFYMKSIYYLFRYDHYLWFLALYFAFSLAGFILSPLFYSFLLLEIMFRVPFLLHMLSTIFKNGKFLGMTVSKYIVHNNKQSNAFPF